MADWGTLPWGLGPYGGSGVILVSPNPPFIVERAPLPGSINVAEETPVSVRFYDVDLNLDPSTISITINGVAPYTGSGGFAAGYAGRTTYSAGSYLVQIFKMGGYGFDTVVTVTAYAADLTALSVSDTWSWTTRADPVCYSGLTPLPIEIAIQSPLITFLDIEPARRVFMDNDLGADPLATRAITSRGNKAARVLYQMAFETELSAVLNPFALKNTKALQVVVCERQNMILLDAALARYQTALKAGIQSLFNLRALPEPYVSSFLEYLDSTLPTYRVSLVANMVLLAKAKELNL